MVRFTLQVESVWKESGIGARAVTIIQYSEGRIKETISFGHRFQENTGYSLGHMINTRKANSGLTPVVYTIRICITSQ